MEGSLSACWLAVGPRSAGGSTMIDTKNNAFLGKLNFSHCSLEQSRNYKRKLTYSSSNDSEQGKLATLKYDSESDKSSNDNSEVSHYGFEDCNDKLFAYNMK